MKIVTGTVNISLLWEGESKTSKKKVKKTFINYNSITIHTQQRSYSILKEKHWEPVKKISKRQVT